MFQRSSRYIPCFLHIIKYMILHVPRSTILVVFCCCLTEDITYMIAGNGIVILINYTNIYN